MNKRIGYINLGSYESRRDAEGGLLCLNCDKLITAKRRRRYCCYDCSIEFVEKNSHQMLRSKLIKESQGKCEHCGNVPTKRENRYPHLTDNEWKEIKQFAYIIKFTNEYILLLDDSQLILDHKNPIALGGAEFDRTNLQILCVGCHKIKTRLDQAKIAMFRKTEVPPTQTKLVFSENR